MAYKTIAVWLDARRTAPTDVAMALALEQGAHLTALNYLDITRLPPFIRAHLGEDVARAQLAQAESAASARAAAFEAAAKKAGLTSYEVRRVADDPVGSLALSARYADLVVMGQVDPQVADTPAESDFPDHAILASGRPTLLVPYVGSYPSIGKHVVVAWNASRESTRAVTDALPLLQRASRVTIITGDARPGAGGHGAEPGADIALYLSRHGVRVTVSTEQTAGIDIGSMLLSRIADLGADLLVMGAYGHSRLRELVLGGATRTVLSQMTVPVLMSH